MSPKANMPQNGTDLPSASRHYGLRCQESSPLRQLVTAGLPGRAEACAALMQSPMWRGFPTDASAQQQQEAGLRLACPANRDADERAAAATRIRAVLTYMLSIGVTRATLLQGAKEAGQSQPGISPISRPDVDAITSEAIANHLRKRRRATKA